MNRSVTIGGIEIGVSTDDAAIDAILDERYGAFTGPVVSPVMAISLAPNGIAKGLPNPPFAEVVGAGTSHLAITHVDFAADLDLAGEGSVTTATDPFTIDHIFRLLMGALAPRHDALMLHACGVDLDGLGHVFAGESGAGKSTLASLAGTHPVLSDEHVLVRRTADGWVLASTPFWGAYALPSANRHAPLATLWSLRQAEAHAVTPLDRAATVKVAVDNAVMPASDAAMKHAVFAVAADLAADIPGAQLSFTPDSTVWQEVTGARAVA